MEKLKAGFDFIFSSYKRTAIVLFIGALTLAIPITVTLVGQQQDIRQRAYTGDVNPTITPSCSNPNSWPPNTLEGCQGCLACGGTYVWCKDMEAVPGSTRYSQCMYSASQCQEHQGTPQTTCDDYVTSPPPGGGGGGTCQSTPGWSFCDAGGYLCWYTDSRCTTECSLCAGTCINIVPGEAACIDLTPTPSGGGTVPLPTATTAPQVTNTPAPTCPRKGEGDADCDGDVDEIDYTIWVNEYITEQLGQTSAHKADFNNNSQTDQTDYAIWMNTYVNEHR